MRPYNFGAGPAMIPEAILREAQAEFLDWQGLGRAVFEVSHRSEQFMQLMSDTEAELRDLLAIPEHYSVLLLPFPARMQFAMVPMNLLAQPASVGAYRVTGTWSAMAYQEATQLAHAYRMTEGDANPLREHTKYVYFTPNETIEGVRTPTPSAGGIPLVADMTSCLLSEDIRMDDYGLIFAGAQKNIAPAGLTVAIIRTDLIGQPVLPGVPTMLNYATHYNTQSLYATPAMFQCYMALKMFRWVKQHGGVSAMARLNQIKAQKLYACIDQSALYKCRVAASARSTINVCFFIEDGDVEATFLQQANARGLYGLKGHKLVGGLRASLYNAMPLEGVEALIAFMREFEALTLGRAYD
jgi:phosphoserine aminotransferase